MHLAFGDSSLDNEQAGAVDAHEPITPSYTAHSGSCSLSSMRPSLEGLKPGSSILDALATGPSPGFTSASASVSAKQVQPSVSASSSIQDTFTDIESYPLTVIVRHSLIMLIFLISLMVSLPLGMLMGCLLFLYFDSISQMDVATLVMLFMFYFVTILCMT